MIYRVILHYYKYDFADPYDALKFAQMAFTAATEEDEDVDIKIIKKAEA